MSGSGAEAGGVTLTLTVTSFALTGLKGLLRGSQPTPLG